MKPMKMMVSGAVCALQMFFCAPAMAQDQTQGSQTDHRGQDFRAACATDMQTYCASAQSRQDRHQCMQANRDKFSDTCKAALDSHRHHHDGQ